MKVLAFMCSRHRPLMLRHAVLQMAAQSYPVDIAVYINSNEVINDIYSTDYSDLIKDISDQINQKIHVKYGKSYHQHINHFEAINLVNLNDYDLFLKIDDDDIYNLNYVKETVDDFIKNHWALSGIESNGTINGYQWKPNDTIKNMAMENSDLCCGMPGSWAFSREAIKAISTVDKNSPWFEDRLWKHHLEHHTDLKLSLRSNPNHSYHYNIHGKNTSTAHWFENNTQSLLQHLVTMNSFQAIRTAVYLIKRALPRLPKDLLNKLSSKKNSL